MWCVPSRSRPHNVARLLKAASTTQELGAKFILMLDKDDPDLGAYPTVPVDDVGERLPLSLRYNAFYERYPDLDWYGFLADDVVPETKGWDKHLVEVAGRDGMAVPAGGHDPEGTPHFVLGGDLVREIGWLALPGLDRLYIDTVWGDIARKRGVLRRCPKVMVRHHHFSNGLALMDATYRKHHKAEDKAIYEAWRDGRKT